jgi:hypothetical protein
VACRRWNSLRAWWEKSTKRECTQGGISGQGGDHWDLTYSLGVSVVLSRVGEQRILEGGGHV